MAQPQQPTKETLTKKFNIDEDVPARESLVGDEASASWSAASDDTESDAAPEAQPATNRKQASAAGSQSGSRQSQQFQGGQMQPSGDAIDALRTSVVGVLESVVREYEPQIAEFTSNVAHQAVDRGVDFAQVAVGRVKAQSWLRIGLAAALGVGIIAVLGYEAEKSAAAPRAPRKPTH